MKLMTIVGTRPQFIKLAPLVRAIEKWNTKANRTVEIIHRVIHTGQHYDFNMSQVFLDQLGLAASMTRLQIKATSPSQVMAEMMLGIDLELQRDRPDYILVYGDTNSTLAGALTASKAGIPIVHVEAGERSYNRTMPEEINRVVTDHLSTICFCCSANAETHLKSEGIGVPTSVVGDVMLDLFLQTQKNPVQLTAAVNALGPYVLATFHRPQNVDDSKRLSAIVQELKSLPYAVLLPLHPRTQDAIRKFGIELGGNLHDVPPLSYFELVTALAQCEFVITDSGGLQKEAFYAKKKALVVRSETEWSELVQAKVARLIEPFEMNSSQTKNWLKDAVDWNQKFYGDGTATIKIVDELVKDYLVRTKTSLARE